MKHAQNDLTLRHRMIAGIFIALFILSRVLTFNYLPLFFDSQEYITRISSYKYIDALSMGHLPLHSGYPAIMWPVYHATLWTPIQPLLMVILLQIGLAIVSLIFFYRTCNLLFSKKVAVYSTILIAFIPLLWISQVTIMMESVYIPFFLISLYYALLYSKIKQAPLYLLTCVLSYGFSLFSHFGVILWLPLLLYICYAFARKKIIFFSVSILISVIAFSTLIALLLSMQTHQSFTSSFYDIYLGKSQERSLLYLDLHSLLVIFRNTLIPLFRNNTFLITCLSGVGFYILFQKSKKYFFIFLLWVIPVILANLWWDSLFFGRHALPATFALVILVSLVVQRHKYLFLLILMYLIITVLPAIGLLRQPTPYLETTRIVSSLPKNGLYIESHFARPQVEKKYRGEVFFVDEPGFSTENIRAKILWYLTHNRKVFVSSHALSEPYGLFSGPYLHSLSLSYNQAFRLQSTLSHFSMKKVIDGHEVDVYQVISYSPSPYPTIESMRFSNRRIDYYDPFFQIWKSISLMVMK